MTAPGVADRPPAPRPPGTSRDDTVSPTPSHPGADASAAGNTLTAARVAAWPVLDRLLRRLRREDFLRGHLPREGRHARVPTATALMILLQHLWVAREPLYGVGEWAARHHPTPLGLATGERPALNDDRVGRVLDRLFEADVPAFTRAVVAPAVREFAVALEERHNASTTITVHGDDEGVDRERTLRGRLRLAVTPGHNKDHRPDLKPRLGLLTVARDGAVPVQWRVESGTATDDRSPPGPWEQLCRLSGRRDFLSVADGTLATAANLAPLHQHGGRLLPVLPRTRGEDAAFQAAVREGQARWRTVPERRDEGEVVDRFGGQDPEAPPAEGDRWLGSPSVRPATLDALTRPKRRERAATTLAALRAQLPSPRTRSRERAKLTPAVDAVLRDGPAAGRVAVTVAERTTATYRQAQRGRPGPDTKSVRHQAPRFALSWPLDHDRLAAEAWCDGVFPLVTHVTALSALERLLGSQPPPRIEKRFSPLKTDCVVAPVFRKAVSRVPALVGVYGFALLVEALLERARRRAMAREGVESLPLYPEGRACHRPTARRVLELFEAVQRHELKAQGQPAGVFTTELTRLQRQVLRRLGVPGADSS